jgi:hypothetical protein
MSPRHALVRAALVVAAAAGTLSLAAPPLSAPLGTAGIVPGMTRAAALAQAGPGALVGPLCEGNEGVTFTHADSALALRAEEPVVVMAMFADGAVTEVDVMTAETELEMSQAACLDAASARLAALARQHGVAPPALALVDDSGLHHVEARFPAGAQEVRVIARHMPASGACFINLRWVAAGQRSVIP